MDASPFARLRKLLADLEAGDEPIDLSIGSPRHQAPAFIAPILNRCAAAFNRYPTVEGESEWRNAVRDWLERRYPALKGAVDPDRCLLPLCGSREGLFLIALDVRKRLIENGEAQEKTLALIPDPGYRTYVAAAQSAGFSPCPLPPGGPGALSGDILDRVAIAYLTSPSNPQGDVIALDELKAAIQLARRRRFTLIIDECYSEIYRDDAPPGGLEAAMAVHGGFDNVLIFNSLSKRSNLAGLRSGFCAGDPDVIDSFRAMRSLVAPAVPIPIQLASAQAWRDERHVGASRRLYQEKYRIVDALMRRLSGYVPPIAGMFVWLRVGDGVETARRLWKQAGLKTLPGRFLCLENDDRRPSPGDPFLRLALTAEPQDIEQAFARLIRTLDADPDRS